MLRICPVYSRICLKKYVPYMHVYARICKYMHVYARICYRISTRICSYMHFFPRICPYMLRICSVYARIFPSKFSMFLFFFITSVLSGVLFGICFPIEGKEKFQNLSLRRCICITASQRCSVSKNIFYTFLLKRSQPLYVVYVFIHRFFQDLSPKKNQHASFFYTLSWKSFSRSISEKKTVHYTSCFSNITY